MKKAEKLFKDLLNENLGYVDLKPITTIESSPKTNYEIKYAEYLAEETKKAKEDEAVKVVSKKESKHVEEVDSHAFDYADLNNIDNLNAEEFSKGVYFEMNKVRETVSDANIGEAIAKSRKIVAKNLAKDPLFYIKNAAFGVEGLGYQETELEEVSGKHAASGYSDKLKKLVKESLMGESSIDAAELAIQASQAKAGMDEEARPDYPDVDKDGDKEESMEKALKDKKTKKMKKESIDSKLAEIGKEAEAVKLEAQLDYLHEYIQEKVDRVNSINEDDNLKELIDKTKMKQMQREIKELERKKAKMERIYEKSCGKKYAKKGMVDEMDAVSWNEKNNPTRNRAVGERDPKKVGKSTSAYAINEVLVSSLEKMGKEIYNKFDKAGAFNIKAVTSNPGSLDKYMNPVRKDSALVAIAGDNTELNIFTHLDNLQVVQDIIKGFDIKNSYKDAGENDVYFKQAKPGALATNGLVKVVLGSGDKRIEESIRK